MKILLHRDYKAGEFFDLDDDNVREQMRKHFMVELGSKGGKGNSSESQRAKVMKRWAVEKSRAKDEETK